MTEVKIIDGKIVVNKTATTKGAKPPKYRYTGEQYDALLKLAKARGIDTGKKALNTRSINLITAAVIDDFITAQGKVKEK
jgi:hypothetical protein